MNSLRKGPTNGTVTTSGHGSGLGSCVGRDFDDAAELISSDGTLCPEGQNCFPVSCSSANLSLPCPSGKKMYDMLPKDTSGRSSYYALPFQSSRSAATCLPSQHEDSTAGHESMDQIPYATPHAMRKESTVSPLLSRLDSKRFYEFQTFCGFNREASDFHRISGNGNHQLEQQDRFLNLETGSATCPGPNLVVIPFASSQVSYPYTHHNVK